MLRAVVFDYGLVLSGPQDPEAYRSLLRLTGLAPEAFEQHYWADRHAYDEGKLTGLEFWRKLLDDAAIRNGPGLDERLNLLDARMWTTENTAMLDWQQALKERGIKTAILSNMGDNVLASIERTFDWLSRFDVLVWSYRLGIAKPDPAIYRHTLRELGVDPVEALFIDDKPANVDAARALGMAGMVFTDVDSLRAGLTASGFDAQIPVPY